MATFTKDRYYKVEVRGIDAWRDELGWVWNESYVLEDEIYWCAQDLTPRKILRKLREWGYLGAESKGRVRVVDEVTACGGFMEIQDKGTGRPLLALLVREMR